jgi:hypothetical protein
VDYSNFLPFTLAVTLELATVDVGAIVDLASSSRTLVLTAPMQTGPADVRVQVGQLARAPFGAARDITTASCRVGQELPRYSAAFLGEQCSRRWNTLQWRACRGDLSDWVVYDELALTENAVFVRWRRF